MGRVGIVAVGLVLVLALGTATVFAVWPVVGEAPWLAKEQATPLPPTALPMPASVLTEDEARAAIVVAVSQRRCT